MGCVWLFVKLLAPNDNSKNQIFLANDPSELSMLPSGSPVLVPGKSAKHGSRGEWITHFPLNFAWLTHEGQQNVAGARFIFYPQYPEVRLSGLLRGASDSPSELLDPTKRGREPGRILLIGINPSEQQLYAVLLASNSKASIDVLKSLERMGTRPIQSWAIGASSTVDSRVALLQQLCRIRRSDWISGKRLTRDGVESYNASNGGGYTLEAELGIRPNGYAEPDFLDWEVKQHGVGDFGAPKTSAVTLFTPEPDGGVYVEDGVEAFLSRWGKRSSRLDRIDFAFRHKVGARHQHSGLTLQIDGYDRSEATFDVNGRVSLVGDNDQVAASWSFLKLLEHWKRKHSRAVYVPSMTRTVTLEGETRRQYRYSSTVELGEGTLFALFLDQLDRGNVVYDPGIHKTLGLAAKKRNQFRIQSQNLSSLYTSYSKCEACAPLSETC